MFCGANARTLTRNVLHYCIHIFPHLCSNLSLNNVLEWQITNVYSIYFSIRIQEEREERHKYKTVTKTPIESELDLFMKSGDMGSFDNGDPTTTNLYLGNLNPKVSFVNGSLKYMKTMGCY